MLNDIELTIITPVFNGQDHIAQTVESVLNRVGSHRIEYIVIDDGSTDVTAEILSGYKDRLTVVSQDNQGESSAVNLGISIAKGEYLLVVSADDPLLTSELFEGLGAFFQSNPDVVVWYPDWQIIDESGEVIEIKSLPEYSEELLIGQFNCLPGPGTVFRTTTAKLINGRNTNFRFTGDYDFWLRMSRLGRFQHRPGVMAQWRSHKGSTSISHRGVEMSKERIGVIANFVQSNSLTPVLKKMALGNAYFYAARLCFFDRKVPGKRLLIKGFWYRRGWIEQAKPRAVVFILLTPISSSIYNFLLNRFGRS